jgi:hypothetical protein
VLFIQIQVVVATGSLSKPKENKYTRDDEGKAAKCSTYGWCVNGAVFQTRFRDER